jgi:hypothetical protein
MKLSKYDRVHVIWHKDHWWASANGHAYDGQVGESVHQVLAVAVIRWQHAERMAVAS